MEILLDDDGTASSKCGVLFSDERGLNRLLPVGILRPIDEADEVATIEVAEPMHLVHGGDGGSKAGHDVRRKLEAQVHSLRSDVEEQIAWRRDGVPFSRVISRNDRNSKGFGGPKRLSQASDPNAMTQERLPSSSRNPAERTRPLRSLQKCRIVDRFFTPGWTVTTRKIAARVNGEATGCGIASSLGILSPRGRYRN